MSDEQAAVEGALDAIRTASAGDLTVPDRARSLIEGARRAGATLEQAQAAADENPYWPD